MELFCSARLRETYRLPLHGPGETTYGQIAWRHGHIYTHARARTHRAIKYTPRLLWTGRLSLGCVRVWITGNLKDKPIDHFQQMVQSIKAVFFSLFSTPPQQCYAQQLCSLSWLESGAVCISQRKGQEQRNCHFQGSALALAEWVGYCVELAEHWLAFTEYRWLEYPPSPSSHPESKPRWSSLELYIRQSSGALCSYQRPDRHRRTTGGGNGLGGSQALR